MPLSSGFFDDVLEAEPRHAFEARINFRRWLIGQSEFRLAGITTRFLDETPLPSRSPFLEGQPASPWSDRTGRRLTPHRSSFAFESEARDERWQQTVIRSNRTTYS